MKDHATYAPWATRRLAVAAVSLLGLGVSQSARAGNGVVHVWLVRDAVNYMLSPNASPTQRAAGFHYLTQYGYSKKSLGDFLGVESKKFDKRNDLYFRITKKKAICRLKWGFSNPNDARPEYSGYEFTAMNHFQEARAQVPTWQPHDGYHYYHSSMAGDDRTAMIAHSGLTNWAIYCGIKPIESMSTSLHYARNTGSLDHGPSFPNQASWGAHWDKLIKDTKFVPISALAQYHYGRFIATGNLADLAPVFHAAGDVVVPQHVFSALGSGHAVTEDIAEWLYKGGGVRAERRLIRDHLAQRPFLSRGLGYGSNRYFQVIPMLSEMAEYALGVIHDRAT